MSKREELRDMKKEKIKEEDTYRKIIIILIRQV